MMIKSWRQYTSIGHVDSDHMMCCGQMKKKLAIKIQHWTAYGGCSSQKRRIENANPVKGGNSLSIRYFPSRKINAKTSYPNMILGHETWLY